MSYENYFGEEQELSFLDKLRWKIAGAGIRTAQGVATGRIQSGSGAALNVVSDVGTSVAKDAKDNVVDAAKCVSNPLACWWRKTSTPTKVIVIGVSGFVGLGAVLVLLHPYISIADKIL